MYNKGYVSTIWAQLIIISDKIIINIIVHDNTLHKIFLVNK